MIITTPKLSRNATMTDSKCFPIKLYFLQLILLLSCSFLFSKVFAENELPLNLIKLPAGFSISIFANNVPDARSMTLSPSGTLFVSTRKDGRIYALQDRNQDGVAERRYVIAENMDMPNGIAFHKGDLYVAEMSRIVRYKNIEANLQKPSAAQVIYNKLPKERHHGWRYLAIGPDDKLYVSVGAPCNVCDEAGYAEIKRLSLDGKEIETYASGIRNSVGFSWHPVTKDLWFTDNGRDHLGDDQPADELNVVTQAGQHFGFPYCHAGDLPDPIYGRGNSCQYYIAPVQKLGAHVASLGMRFYSGKQFPNSYRHNIFIAEHGSWNRTNKVGYRISMLKINQNKSVAYTTFASGWLQGEQSWGRPVDVQVDHAGALLVSDDKAGVIYRIQYRQQ